MATCFLFIKQLEDEKILSLKLDRQGQVVAGLAIRSLDEIKTLQQNATTWIVLPADVCGIHEVPLPWVSERKARAAIPYALEEQLAQSVTTLHFAFGRQQNRDNQYLVVVIDKAYLSELLDRLDVLGLKFDAITVDWFALNEGESCITEDMMLVHDPVFTGALGRELARVYLKGNPRTERLTFKNSAAGFDEGETTAIDEEAKLWIAKRLQQNQFINLCQGEFQRDEKSASLRFWYLLSAGLVGISLISLLVLNLSKVIILNHKISGLDQEIAVIYHEFFPEARQVISPKFRIEQALKGGDAAQQGAFWKLLLALGQNYDPNLVTIQQILYQNKGLSVTLESKDFVSLEALQTKIRQANIHVQQIQASTQDGKVLATLELKL